MNCVELYILKLRLEMQAEKLKEFSENMKIFTDKMKILCNKINETSKRL